LPSVELDILQMSPGENENEVLSGKYDFCFMAQAPAESPKLTQVIIFEEKVMVALPKGHALAANASLTAKQIAAETYIDRLHCEFRSQLIHHFMDRNIVMRPKVQSEREDWVQHLVATGVGICAMPERSALTNDLVVRPVDGLDLKRQVTLVAVSGSGNAREVRLILDLAKRFDW
ncbi:MAG: LysR family transcriptional regulator substrate-binding protein, partial [Planktomarina sp.]